MTNLIVDDNAGSARPAEALRFISVRADLLPDEIVDARRGRTLHKIIVGAILGLVVLLAALTLWARMQTSSAESSLADSQIRGTTLLREQSQFTPLVTAQGQAAALEKQLATLMAPDIDWNKLISSVRAAAPAAVTVTSVTGSLTPSTGTAPSRAVGTKIGKIALAGSSPDPNAIATYLDALKNIAGIAAPYPAGVSATDGGYTFTANLDITDKARGGRYSQTSGGN